MGRWRLHARGACRALGRQQPTAHFESRRPVSSVSQYRTNTERQRMRELGQERNVQVLWLLTLSAPEGAYAGLQLAFEKAASSFTVPDVSLAD